jgi:hypothetical protein
MRKLILLLLVLVASCSTSRGGTELNPSRCGSSLVRVMVENQSWQDYRIYDGERRRLGYVSGKSEYEMTQCWSGGESRYILIRPLAGDFYPVQVDGFSPHGGDQTLFIHIGISPAFSYAYAIQQR